MKERIIKTKHKQAYDTEENWKTNNPILLAGQLAYSSDKYGKYKIGDGISHWNELDYCDNNSIPFISDDNLEPTNYSNVELLESGEKHSSILNKLSTMFKNIRYLYKILGTTDISSIGNGTITDAISRINADLAQRLDSVCLSIDDNPTSFAFYALNSESNNLLSLRFDKNQNKFVANLRVDNIWQEEQFGLSARKIDGLVESTMIPYLYKFATAEQPLFVISENSEDTMYCNGRGCKRDSNEKALIFKVNSYALKSGLLSIGYGIISSTSAGTSCTPLTDYGNIGNEKTFKTPSGKTVYYQEMSSRWENTNPPVVATVNGNEQKIEGCCVYPEVQSIAFLLAMCDFYLF